MSKSLKEILSTPIKDTTVSEIRLQVVVGLPLPLIIIYFISLFFTLFYFICIWFFSFRVYMFFIKKILKIILIYIVKKKVKSILLRVYV